VVQAMERMRELVRSSTSSSTELAASSDQMSKMSRGLLDSMDRFSLQSEAGSGLAARQATAGSR
jgi:methyl-accepting chemotaxis protein